MIHEEDKGSSWNRCCQWLRYREQVPLSITSQGKRLAAFGPTGHNGFPIIPSSPVFDRQSRLPERRLCRNFRREALQIRRKLHGTLSDNGEGIGSCKP